MHAGGVQGMRRTQLQPRVSDTFFFFLKFLTQNEVL